jgi:hypothetical protein
VIYPAELSGNQRLPLAFAGIRAETASVVTVDISNYGKEAIGRQESHWELTLRFPDAAIVAPLGALKTSPAPIVASVLHQTDPRELTLGIGLLEPSAHTDVALMLINDRRAGYSRAEAKATLAGLPVETTTASPEERLQKRLWIPVTLGIFAAALVAGLRERKSKLAAGTGKVPSVGTAGFVARSWFFRRLRRHLRNGLDDSKDDSVTVSTDSGPRRLITASGVAASRLGLRE